MLLIATSIIAIEMSDDARNQVPICAIDHPTKDPFDDSKARLDSDAPFDCRGDR